MCRIEPERMKCPELTSITFNYLYTVKAQNIAAQYYYRPRDEKVAAKYAVQFPPLESFTIDEMFGGWKEARNTHFADGGVFDRIQDYLAALQ